MKADEIKDYKKAGEISQKTREYIKEIVKPGVLLVDLVKMIHDKIEELGGGIAFPVSLSIDDVAAHFSPALEDETKANGLIKVDFGIHVNGFIADSAITIDLTDDNRHKDLIDATELALKNVLELLEKDPTLHEMGELIQKTIEDKGFSPVVNLSGHSVDEYKIHAGITLPNYGNGNENKLEPGSYAVEPFATTGEGKIYGSGPGNVYEVVEVKNVRSETARKVLEYVLNKYKTLPFSLMEIQEKFGNMARLALKELENQGIVQTHARLVEVSHKPVAQAEHTFIKSEDGKIFVSTRG